MSTGDELARQTGELKEVISGLSQQVKDLSSKVGEGQDKLNRTVKRYTWLTWALAASLGLNLVLTGAVIWNAARIADVQARTSNQVLCPLYKIFIDSYHPERQPPERLPEYEASFAVIRHSYEVLECG